MILIQVSLEHLTQRILNGFLQPGAPSFFAADMGRQLEGLATSSGELRTR